MLLAKIDAQELETVPNEMRSATNAKRYRRLKVIDLSVQGFRVPELVEIFERFAGPIHRYLQDPVPYRDGDIWLKEAECDSFTS